MAIQRIGKRLVLSKLFVLAVTPFLFFSCDPVASSNEIVTPVDANSAEVMLEPTQLFLQHCESCHGMNGDKGVSNAANLKQSMLTDLQIRNTILKGTPNGMMPFAEKLNDQQVTVLVEYVKMLKYK
ncbi:MAG TPA: cytochrome c [Crocinitomicaceae bacterium]|nr:cytochrome c [Crocinitomicaceae bacterium]